MKTYKMVSKKLIERIKHSAVIASIGVFLGVVPFYFQTKAMTEDNNSAVIEHKGVLKEQDEKLNGLEIREAINDTEIQQIKESLDRIEGKIDRLIEREQPTQ